MDWYDFYVKEQYLVVWSIMLRLWFLILGPCIGIASSASCIAQPLLTSICSIDARVAVADTVILGTIEDLPAKNGADGESNGGFLVTLRVKEVFKGKVDSMVSDLPAIAVYGTHSGMQNQPEIHTLGKQGNGHVERFRQWKTAKTEFLCFLGPPPTSDQLRKWSYHALGPLVEAESQSWNRVSLAPSLTRDLKVLKTEEEVLARAREYAKLTANVKSDSRHATVFLQLPNLALLGYPVDGQLGWTELPIDSALEDLAHRMIDSPQSFIPEKNPYPNDWPYWEKHKSHACYKLKVAGIRCLKHFNTKSNVAILQNLMDEDPAKLGLGANFKSIRHHAFEVLLGWNINLDRPDFWQTITDLDLSESDINDKTLRIVGQLTNLKKLNLRATEISYTGLARLNQLQQLATLELNSNQLNDQSLRALNRAGLIHTISAATSSYGKNNPSNRPDSPADVASLSLWHSPISDEGLKQFKEFENVIELYLCGSRITANGLDDLTHMTGLKILNLEDTQISEDGIQTLAQFKHLQSLNLKNLAITDSATNDLTRVKGLIFLNIVGTKITSAGVEKLKRALPKCRIVSSIDKVNR